MKISKITFIFSFILSLLSSLDLHARPLIADLSIRKIEINSSFKGAEILLFGARNEAGDIVIVIRGPQQSYVMRRKRKIGFIWANKDKAVLEDVQSYNSFASNRPLQELRNERLLKVLNIGTDNIPVSVRTKKEKNISSFQSAFFEERKNKGLYFPEIGEVEFIGDTLFRTILKFPDNIPRGTYTAETYLFSDGQLNGFQSTPLNVEKVGFDAFIYNLAYNHPLLYGILAVSIAIFAGWVAGLLFRKVT
jgi:uncharacterized protein (TIGR02186 family)